MKAPPFLSLGDEIAVVAPSGRVVVEKTTQGIDMLKAWGFETHLGTYLFENHFRFAGTNQERLKDFQQALDNPNIKAIFCARGGYGLTKIIDRLDFTHFKQSPKWIIGFSDITALLCHLYRLGIQSIHGAMPNSFSNTNSIYLTELKNLLLGKMKNALVFDSESTNRAGNTNGKLIGGNLSILTHLIGTPSEPGFSDAILFIEDLNEELYHTERMLVQLKRAGVFDKTKAVILGTFTDMKDSTLDPFGKTVMEMVLDLTNESIPIASGLPLGHGNANYPLIIGAKISVEIEAKKTIVRYC